jgi:hypothetical protein
VDEQARAPLKPAHASRPRRRLEHAGRNDRRQIKRKARMKTSRKLDKALLAILLALLTINAAALVVWQVRRTQDSKPGGKDPTVEWWLAGEPVHCKHGGGR